MIFIRLTYMQIIHIVERRQYFEYSDPTIFTMLYAYMIVSYMIVIDSCTLSRRPPYRYFLAPSLG